MRPIILISYLYKRYINCLHAYALPCPVGSIIYLCMYRIFAVTFEPFRDDRTNTHVVLYTHMLCNILGGRRKSLHEEVLRGSVSFFCDFCRWCMYVI
jgi:hypothetical protein